jgi:hypothetical protein
MSMRSVHSARLPDHALLRRYSETGAYTDCYAIDVAAPYSHADYVEGFYTTSVFRFERLVLSWLISKPSSDTDARDLALGRREVFAAWHVEACAPDQLLMCDFLGRTRSWLMVVPQGIGTRLYFGSAVVPIIGRRGEKRVDWRYRTLLGFHKLYSRVLLRAAARRLETLVHRAK